MATKAQKATTQSESPQQQTLPMQYDVLSIVLLSLGFLPFGS